jgi:hypothetical protein
LAGGARTEIAYRSLFGFLTVILICAVAMYSRSEDIKPSHEMRQREQAKAA